MEKYNCGNACADIHFAVSYCVKGESSKTTVDYGTASIDVERERIALDNGDLITRLKITNTSDNSMKLISAYPILTDNLEIGEFSSCDWKIFNGSRQLGDIPASCILGVRDHSFAHAADRLSDEGMPQRNYTTGDAVLRGDGITIIKSGKTFVCLEVLTNDKQITDISISSDCKGALKAIRVGGEFNCILDCGETIYTDWVRIVTGGNLARLLDEYSAKRKEMSDAQDIKNDGAVCLIDDVSSAEQISEKLSFLKSLRAPFNYVEISGKWYMAAGDWEDGEGINIRHLSALINRSGYRAGIYTMPFLVDKDSELFSAENKWLLRHGDGSYCTYTADGKTYAILDISQDECVEWVAMLYKRLSALGFYLHHADHTICFMLQKDVILHNPKLSLSKAYKNAMLAIKDAIGEDGYLYTTNAFSPMLCGISDSNQICSDISALKDKNNSNICAKIANQCAFRSYSSLWWNSTCGFVFDSEFLQKYSRDEKRYLFACEYICASPAVVGNLSTNDELKSLRLLYPAVPTRVYPRDMFGDNAFVSVVDVEVNDSYHTVCFFNNSFTDVELCFRLDSNLCGGYVDHASEYNISSYFGKTKVLDCKYDDIIKIGTIPPNSCEIVKIAKSDQPHIIFSDMHLSMGGEADISFKDDIVTVSGKNLFNCRGNYVVVLPKNYQCADGRREYSFTINGEGFFSYEKQVKPINLMG